MKNTQTVTTGKTIHNRRENRTRIFKALIASFAFAVLYLSLANTTMADVSTCTNVGSKPFPDGQDSYSIEMYRVNYKGPFNSNSTDSRASNENGQYKVRLQGWLYYSRSSAGEVKNAKVLIYNHGHNDGRGEPCQLVKYFVGKGYVVFAPLRRGHFANASTKDSWYEIRSTGIHIDQYISNCLRSQSQAAGSFRPHLFAGSQYCRADDRFGGVYDNNALDVDYLRRQHIDIRDQIAYIKERNAIGTGGKLADPDQVAILGHSYGGSAVILANKFDYGQNVTISVSGAEKSWGLHNPYWQLDLSDAMQNQASPIYFLGPKNGRTLEPIKTLFGIAVGKEYLSQAAIFPNAPCSDFLPPPDEETCDTSDQTEAEQAHETFIGEKEQIALWGPSVRNFIFRHPRATPTPE